MRDRPTKWAGMLGVLALWMGLMGSPAAARPLQDVLNYGTLRVGVALFPPWTMRDPSGELTGFEIDVARKLAEDMHVDVEFSLYPWDRIILGLEAGEIDIIAAGLSIAPERALHVAFSRPYATSGTTLATNLETTSDVTSLDDLNDTFYTSPPLPDPLPRNWPEGYSPGRNCSSTRTPKLPAPHWSPAK